MFKSKKLETMSWKQAQKEIETGVVYLEFWVSWCPDCLNMDKTVDQVVKHFQKNKNFKFIRVDAEESGLFRKNDNRFNVLRVPTHIIMKDNQILNHAYEYVLADDLIEWIDNALALE